MNNDENTGNQRSQEDQGLPEKQSTIENQSWFARSMETLIHLGLGEVVFRIGTNVLAVGFVLLVIWLMSGFYSRAAAETTADLESDSLPTNTAPLTPTIQSSADIMLLDGGITRGTSLHTSIPSRPRIDAVSYTVQTGDSVFGIAEKFGLNPSTILFGNYATLKDTPHSLRPEQVLTILPVDGTYYEWQGTENLEKVAEFFGVDADAIISYPGNHLDSEAIGDIASPNIPAGTWLIVPGGRREFISWSAPIGVTRDNPAVARVMGEGACGSIVGGAIGYGTFVWPTNAHYLSGYDYSPDTNHRGIDLAGNTGDAIYATDAGVIVYAGWNDYGYGYLLMIDHGQGWQSLYAHLSAFNVTCGQSVGQGEVIAAMGSTGNSSGSHLHFELMSTTYGKVDPKMYLP